jgi:hypothetical protein
MSEPRPRRLNSRKASLLGLHQWSRSLRDKSVSQCDRKGNY